MYSYNYRRRKTWTQEIKMGCDIHMYLEKKKNGAWVPAQGFVKMYEDLGSDVPYPDRFTERDYHLFGFLAGVRAPEYQHFEPKGFPPDACPEVRQVYERYGSDAHTPSYLTLSELNKIKWDTEMVKTIFCLRKDQYNEFQRTISDGKPDYNLLYPWSRWKTDMNEWVDVCIETPLRWKFISFYEYVSRITRYDYECSEFRIVFWFDN